MLFPIESWDVTYVAANTKPYDSQPVLTFTPSPQFLEFARRNNYLIQIDIHNTFPYLKHRNAGIYDGTVWAIVDNYSMQPNYNLYTAQSKYQLILQTPWWGYPDKNSNSYFEVMEGVIVPDNQKRFEKMTLA